jgi:hypothetical protein
MKKCKFEDEIGYCKIHTDDINIRDVRCNTIVKAYCIYFMRD